MFANPTNFRHLGAAGLARRLMPTVEPFSESILEFFTICRVPNKRYIRRLEDPLLTMILFAPNEKQDKENLGQKRLSDNTKVDFGAMKDHR